jgi:hypothetical protein
VAFAQKISVTREIPKPKHRGDFMVKNDVANCISDGTVIAKAAEILAPRSLTKAEKLDFERVVTLLNEAGKPVSAAEIDTIVDYCSARSRLAQLRKLLRQQDATADFDRLLAANRAINATASAARRLARDLGLTI